MNIDQIRTDGGTQPRASINNEVVQDYARNMVEGAIFPAIVVFYDGAVYWLADGFHRVAAAKVARLTEIAAEVRQGTQRDAVLYAAGANSTHGMRRTNEDKRRAVQRLLDDAEWTYWPNRSIARQCAVDEGLVRKMRPVKQKTADNPHSQQEQSTNASGNQTANAPEDDGATNEHSSKATPSTFNRTNDSIEWAWWTWNPVTGCRHGCAYCYARDIAMRFSGTFAPQFHPDRLEAPRNTKVPHLPLAAAEVLIGSTNVFVCSMADLFGEWVPQSWIDDVLDAVRAAPQWNFIFLTKNPNRMVGISWPANAWVGTTVDCQARVASALAAFGQINALAKFVSCEPMNEPLDFGDGLSMFDWVIIGGRSASSGAPEFKPPWQWSYRLALAAHDAGCKVYEKPNIGETRIREYPCLNSSNAASLT